jgi:hypothetical protein
MKLVACNAHIGSSVAAKRCQIQGGDDDAMLFHWEESATPKMVLFRRNPSGRRGLRAISLLRAVVDERASTSVPRLDLTHKTRRAGGSRMQGSSQSTAAATSIHVFVPGSWLA